MWQEIIVGLCVLAAGIFLVRHWLFPGKKSSNCGGCNNCDTNKPARCNNTSEGKPS